ncbi:MAG: TetR/AcrR family transcriptional regulator [Desulfobulbaceae bacterium]|nr:TetR/AcrR family transcriptional regulator [Desulfobulbaceae bacterium]
MAGLREQRKKRTRAAILEAALHLFSRQGYENTSINQMAKAAGIGKGTIYSYFQSKSEIFLAFCEDQFVFIDRELSEKSRRGKPLIEQLLTLFMGEFQFVSRNKEFGRILMRETVFPKELTVERSQELDNKYIELMVPLFKQAQKRGELRTDLELILVVGHFYGLYIMTVSGWYMGRLLTEEDVAMVLESLFLQALEGLSPAGTKKAMHNE